MKNLSYKTAITRKELSAPMHRIMRSDYIFLPTFNTNPYTACDYGCGKGSDVDILSKTTKIKFTKYDPYYFPEFPKLKFSYVFCIYVLNVIESESERVETVKKMLNLLDYTGNNSGGSLFIAVRTIKDLKSNKNLIKYKDGFKTKIFKDESYQFQKDFNLDELLKLIKKTNININVEAFVNHKKFIYIVLKKDRSRCKK